MNHERTIAGRGASAALAMVLMCWSTLCLAQDRDAYDEALLESLRQQRSDLVEPFRQANEARKRDDLTKAAELYQSVRDQLPTFSAATRRLCGVELQQGHRQQAIELCRAALNSEDLPENQSALAAALLDGSQGTPSFSDRQEAASLARKAVTRQPRDTFSLSVLCEAALKNEDLNTLRSCSGTLSEVDPNSPQTLLFLSLSHASDGRLDEAFTALERAHDAGLADETYNGLRASYEQAQPWYDRWGGLLLRILIAWVAGFAALFGIGWLLSLFALRAASKMPSEASGRATGVDLFLRRLYRLVLWICCAYYYVSLPLVLVIVIGIGGALIYGMLMIGHIPIKLLLIVAVIAFVTIGAVVKSLFVRAKETDPGERLNLDEHPRFRKLLEEVAERVGTRPVDAMFLTPETDVAVFERGGLLKQLTGRTERCLVLGAGALDGFKVLPFKAVLAHEYGHFHNEDTAGGGFALAVRRSVLVMGTALAQGGAAAWYNPAWIFVNGFLRLFLRISHGASRLQEVLADRWAAFAYGANAFSSGLRHVIERSIRFDVHLQQALGEVIEHKKGLVNLYRYEVKGDAPEESEFETAIEDAIHAPPSPYASHPSPIDRIEWVRALPPKSSRASEDDDLEVWSLFENREELERQMTDRVREAVEANHGVFIPDVEAPKRKRKKKSKKAQAGAGESASEEQASTSETPDSATGERDQPGT